MGDNHHREVQLHHQAAQQVEQRACTDTSSPPVGSSINTSFGCVTRLRQSANVAAWPPEKVVGRSSIRLAGISTSSSHFCAAERQFRTPLSYGAVRTPTAQWTATAAGCCLLQPQGEGVGIAAATFGRVQDYQVKDINNMGAAMAPAAASTLLHYFKDTGTEPQEFDCIYTGDLGRWAVSCCGSCWPQKAC